MRTGVVAKKLGMTQVFTEQGERVPVTVLQMDNVQVVAHKTKDKDGYTALGTVFKAGRSVNTYLLYTQSFVDYVLVKGSIARPARGDYSHQTVITQAGVSLP